MRAASRLHGAVVDANEVELVRRSDLVEVLPELVRFGIPRSWLKRELWHAVPRTGFWPATLDVLRAHWRRMLPGCSARRGPERRPRPGSEQTPRTRGRRGDHNPSHRRPPVDQAADRIAQGEQDERDRQKIGDYRRQFPGVAVPNG